MVMQGIMNRNYVEGNSKARFVFFAFLVVWIASGFTLIEMAENKIAEITSNNASVLLSEMSRIYFLHVTLPMSLFFATFGAYMIFTGLRTVQTRTYPPPGMLLPFKSKCHVKFSIVSLISLGYFLAGMFQFCIIGMFVVTHFRIKPM